MQDLSLLTSLPVDFAILLVDQEGVILSVNDSLRQLAPKQISHKANVSASKVLSAIYPSVNWDNILNKTSSEQSKSISFQLNRADHIDNDLVIIQPIKRGELTNIVILIHPNVSHFLDHRVWDRSENINSVVKSRSKLERVNDLFKLLLKATEIGRIGYWEVDIQQNLCTWSDMVYEIHEEDKSKAIKVADGINYYHPDHRQLIQEAVKNAIENAEKWDLELKIITAKKNERWVRAIGHVSHNQEGEAVKLYGLFYDIHDQKSTEIKHLDNKLALPKLVDEKTKELKEINDELNSFTYSVSHDMKAPLRRIKSYTDILIDEYAHDMNDDMLALVNRIADSSMKMSNSINELLEYSKLNTKKLYLESLDINEILEEIIDRIFIETREKIDIDKLPRISGDRNLVTHLFENLLSNAIKYSSKSENQKIAVYQVKDFEKEIVIAVKDNGVGFDMSYYQKLFDVFQRLHTDQEFPGTGIGLSFCQKIMKAHKGKIWAESTPGQGATFYVSFSEE